MKLMLDKECFSCKPTSEQIWKINNRLMKSSVDVSTEDLAKALVAGKSFTPAYFQQKDGFIKRNKEYWISQKVIGLDFDEGMNLKDALNEFKDSAAFIYTTFSHTEKLNKFRVIFILEKTCYEYDEVEKLLKKLLDKYPMADKSCKDCTRLFFGGKELFELNYKNRIKISNYIGENQKVFSKTDDSEYISILPKSSETQKAKPSLEHYGKKRISKPEFKVNNVHLIKEQNVKALREILKPSSKTVHTEKDRLDFLKQQDLRKFLGIEGKGNFLDIFHEENNASASIFESNCSNGHWLYKCFSSNKPFKGSIVEVTMKLTETTKEQTIKFLSEIYNVKISENDVQKKHRLKIERYQNLLESQIIKKKAPTFSRIFSLSNRCDNVINLLDLIKINLPKNEGEKILFHHSINTISKVFDNSGGVTGNKMNIFAFFRIVKKLKKNEVPEQLLKKQLKKQKEKKYKYINSTYELTLPDDVEVFMERAEHSAIEWMDKKMTTKSMNYEGILRNFGLDRANEIFPQDKDKTIPSLNQNITTYITKITLETINEFGWVTEKKILDKVKLNFYGQKGFTQRQLKICLGEMLEAYELEKIRLNKQLKEELEIESKGYGYIIRKEIKHKNV